MNLYLMLKEDTECTRLLGLYTTIEYFSLALTKLSNQRDIIMKEIPLNQSPKEYGMTLKNLNFYTSLDYAIVVEN